MRLENNVVRWGVIGCGQIAVDKAIPGLLDAEGSHLAALSDPLEGRRNAALALAADKGAASPKSYADYHELLADADIDAVYVALPTGMHAEAVVAAASSGKAILCEKPLGRSAGEVRAMIQATQAAGVPLMTAYMSRFGDTFIEAVKLLERGVIGQVTFVYANFSYTAGTAYPLGTPGAWRWTDAKGGGPLLDIGIYLAFGLREMLGERIVRVSPLQCDTIAPLGVPTHDTTAAWFQTEKGIPGVFAATFSHNESRIVFYGTEGRLEISQCFSQRPTGRLECHAGTFHHVLETGGQEDTERAHYDNYRREFAHFSQALLSDVLHRPGVEEVMTDALLLDALQTTGSIVEIPDAHTFLKAG